MAEPMPEHVKTQLREVNARKRAQKTLLKDLTPDDLQVWCDYVEDRQGRVPTIITNTWVAYLKWATPEQVAALKARIPSVEAQVTQPGPDRKVVTRVCFREPFLRAVLRAALTGPHPDAKYTGRMWMDWNGALETR